MIGEAIDLRLGFNHRVGECKPMTGEEFIEKILAGERNFVGIELEDDGLSGLRDYHRMKGYLETQEDLRENPLRLDCSHLIGVEGLDLNFPYSQFREAYFFGGRFAYADFRGADFTRAHFKNTYFAYADFRGADFANAHFENQTEFSHADLRGAKGLEDAYFDSRPHFYNTIVTPKEKKIIEDKLHLFNVRSE